MTATTVIVAPAPAVELAQLEQITAELETATRRVDELRRRRNALIVHCDRTNHFRLVAIARSARVSSQQCLRVIESTHLDR